MFPPQTYTTRRESLCRRCGDGILLLTGNPEVAMNYPANTFPFRQDSHFLYFIGIDKPGLAAILDGSTGECTLFGDELTIEDIVWTGPLPTLTELAARSGITKIRPYAEWDTEVQKAAASGRIVHYLPPYRAENQIRLSAALGIAPAALKAGASEAMIRAVVDLRSVKSTEEIAEIEKAVNLTGRMHLAAMRTAKPGMKESDVVANVLHEVNCEGTHVSFPVILSTRGEVLHNHDHSGVMRSGQLLLVDAGGESHMHYAGDMTRAFPVDKTFTSRQRDVYQIVLDAQMQAIRLSRPGVHYSDIHLAAALTIAEGLRDLGLMKGNAEDAVKEGAHAMFFPHGLGHMMGLDVHDMEDVGETHVGYGDGVSRSSQFGLAYLRFARKLQQGFVVTVEPGIYFIPELTAMWKQESKWNAFIDFEKTESFLGLGGIRIEEDIVITETGCKILGTPVAKTVAEVEKEREKAF